jgi:hypothetical protein
MIRRVFVLLAAVALVASGACSWRTSAPAPNLSETQSSALEPVRVATATAAVPMVVDHKGTIENAPWHVSAIVRGTVQSVGKSGNNFGLRGGSLYGADRRAVVIVREVMLGRFSEEVFGALYESEQISGMEPLSEGKSYLFLFDSESRIITTFTIGENDLCVSPGEKPVRIDTVVDTIRKAGATYP